MNSLGIKKLSWAGAYSVAPKILQGIKFIALTRLLGPNEFGLYAFTLIWVAFAEGLSEFGLKQGIIQQRTAPNIKEGDAVNIILLLRGFLVGVLMNGVALLFRYYNITIDLVSIALISVIPLLRGLYTVSLARTTRDLDFRRLFIFESIWRSLDLIISLILVAGILSTSRSAILATMLAESVAVIVAFFALENRLGFSKDLSQVKHLIHYGRWIWSQSILTVILNQFDKIYVIGYFGSLSMGAYQATNRLMQMCIADPINMLVGVWFPQLAKNIRDDKNYAWEKFRRICLNYLLVMSALTSAISIFRVEIMYFVYGEKWIGFESFIPVFSLVMTVGGLITLLVTWYRCEGSPQWVTFSTILQLIVYVTCILLVGKDNGALGVAFATLLAGVISLTVLIIGLGLKKYRGIVFTKEVLFSVSCLVVTYMAIVNSNKWLYVLYAIIVLDLLIVCFAILRGYRKIQNEK